MEIIIFLGGIALLFFFLYSVGLSDEVASLKHEVNEKSNEIEKQKAIVDALKGAKKSEVYHYHNKD